MAIPKFHEFFLPVLEILSDRQERSIHEIYDVTAKRLELTEEERKMLVPSGVQTVHNNRVSWARTYLKKAGLVSSPRRGYVVITAEGKKLLQSNPVTITLKDLEKYPGFFEFRAVNVGRRKKHAEEAMLHPESTPSERFESAYEELQEGLKGELLDTIMQCSWEFFERLVVDLLINLGYGGSRKEAGEAFATSGDEGIDGVIKEDKLGLDLIYVQAKRWKKESCVGRPEIQKFAGALQGKKTQKGVFITTSYFSKDAVSFAKNIESKIILINGSDLTDYMIDSNTGVTTTEKYELKRIDIDYFEEG